MLPVGEIRNVSKIHNGRKTLSRVSFQIYPGESLGILGPKNSGKSVLFDIVAGVVPPDSGDVYLLGLKAEDHKEKIRANIGALPENLDFEDELTVYENLYLFGLYQRMKKPAIKVAIRELLRMLEVEEFEEEFIRDLTLPVQKRIGLARALINDPKILILDQPTQGFNELQRNKFWSYLADVKNQKKYSMVLLSDQSEEIEALCQRIIILNQGQVVTESHIKDLIGEKKKEKVLEFQIAPRDVDYFVNKVRNLFNYRVVNNKIFVFLSADQSEAQAMAAIAGHRTVLRGSSLDDVFLKLTGHPLVVGEEFNVQSNL